MRIVIDYCVAGLALLLAATSLAAQQSAPPASGAIDYPSVYRVEVIVFGHADGRLDQGFSERPADFTEWLDPLLVARANDIAQRQLAVLAEVLPIARIPGEIDERTPRLESDDQTLRPIPPVYSALGDLSKPIQRAMDRLLDAPEYEPVTARAWIQLAVRGRPTATLRIHDQTMVDLIEPGDDRSLVPEPHVLPFGPLVETPQPGLEIYRLDGSLRLRQRQFLHLDLDVVWQSRARSVADRMLPTDESTAASSGPEIAQGEWQLHRLKQSRIVKPGRFEYFDSSLFGVLVWIERFEQIVPDIEEPELDPATPNSADSAATAEPVTNSNL